MSLFPAHSTPVRWDTLWVRPPNVDQCSISLNHVQFLWVPYNLGILHNGSACVLYLIRFIWAVLYIPLQKGWSWAPCRQKWCGHYCWVSCWCRGTWQYLLGPGDRHVCTVILALVLVTNNAWHYFGRNSISRSLSQSCIASRYRWRMPDHESWALLMFL